jgi:hypothetical protein
MGATKKRRNIMKKRCSLWPVVSVLFGLLVLSAVSASAQSFAWNDPYLIASGHVTAIAVDPVTEAVYGLSDTGNIVTLTLSVATGETVAAGAVPPPVTAFTIDPHGILYAINNTSVNTCSAGTCTATVEQPKLPEGEPGVYKDIAIGKGGKIYVLFELENQTQYLLTGYPPAMTNGVTVAITPAALDLASKGNWVNAFVVPPEGYEAEDILPDSVKIVRIQGTGPAGEIDQAADISRASGAPYGVKGDGLHLKFPRYNKQDPTSSQSLIGLLSPLLPSGDAKAIYNLTLTIEGQLESGEFFSGTTVLRVMAPKAKPAKNKK